MADDESTDHLHPAEITKLEAEARAADALAIRNTAEAKKFEREAERLTAQIRDAESQAQVVAIVAAREVELRDRELASFSHQHVYHFTQAVTADSCKVCQSELNYWSQSAPGCDIEIEFDSPGGSVFDGLALYDYIQELRRRGHRVTTSTRGMAASMAGILLQAGDVRVMSSESWMLIHEVSTAAFGKIGEIEDEVQLVKAIQERVLDIFAARSSLTKKTLRVRWRRRDWWLDSTEALKLGLVDEVR